jgi:hypothetical protein
METETLAHPDSCACESCTLEPFPLDPGTCFRTWGAASATSEPSAPLTLQEDRDAWEKQAWMNRDNFIALAQENLRLEREAQALRLEVRKAVEVFKALEVFYKTFPAWRTLRTSELLQRLQALLPATVCQESGEVCPLCAQALHSGPCYPK